MISFCHIQMVVLQTQNYIELLTDDEYCDITIEVGEEPNVKIIRAHMNILCCRPLYLRKALVTKKTSKDNLIAHINLPKISPKTFQIILKYIYGGILSLNDQDNSDILKLLLAADELLLQEVVDYLQNKIPREIFKSLDFTSLPEKSLIQLIKRDDLQMKEVEVWEYVLKWGLAQNPTLSSDPDTWSDDDFKIMENTLRHCLSLIRFFSLSSKDFLQSVRPYKRILKHQLYEDLLKSHLDPDSKPTDNISLPRNIKINGIIDTKIVKNLSIITTISRQVDKLDIRNNFAHLKEHKFQLLIKGSRDGYTPKVFHELCDGTSHTVTFIKIKGKDEIIGGYNPLIWKSSAGFNGYKKTKESFIFSFKNNNAKDGIISNIEDTDRAIWYNPSAGPFFGQDIIVYADNSLQ
ncbi:hypothetical protein RclHR1_00120027 [Rhizophagus clarus]|uniref:BTB domain-containing protein n=1 Tax=Rhizophagus clarus TaxID=94130 RepID=A0A2Z6Q5X2_9GLOM|nr:hypothetical protein RclHR1_00120027 [Rhizophagus clarus]